MGSLIRTKSLIWTDICQLENTTVRISEDPLYFILNHWRALQSWSIHIHFLSGRSGIIYSYFWSYNYYTLLGFLMYLYRLLHKSRYLCYFRNLRNGTIITKGEARPSWGDYVPFRRSLKSEDTMNLGNNQFRLWFVALRQWWRLPDQISVKITH